MPRWILGLVVLTAWAGAMTWRVERDLLPRWKEDDRTSYRGMLEGKLPRHDRFRLSFHGREVGDLATSATREPDGTVALRQQVELDPAALRTALPVLAFLRKAAVLDGPIAFRLKLTLSPRYVLTGFSLVGSLGSTPFRGGGVMGPKGLEGTVEIGKVGEESVHLLSLPLDPTKPISIGLSPLDAAPDLPIGATWDLGLLNPLTGRTETLRARVDGAETLVLGGRKILSRRIVITHDYAQATVWVDREGRVLKQSMLGMDAVRVEDVKPLEDAP